MLEIKRAVQSKENCFASRKVSLKEPVSLLEIKRVVQSKGDCLASRKASLTAAASMLKNQESGTV